MVFDVLNEMGSGVNKLEYEYEDNYRVAKDKSL